MQPILEKGTSIPDTAEVLGYADQPRAVPRAQPTASPAAPLPLQPLRAARTWRTALRPSATLGRQGDYRGNVLKVNIPRNDLTVTVANVRTPTPFGFGGWVAMTKGTGGMDVLMGDLVLTQDEVNPVMSALLENGLDVTALHNHFFWEEPRIFYMHVHGRGAAAKLARQLKPALELIGTRAPSPATAGSPALISISASRRSAVASSGSSRRMPESSARALPTAPRSNAAAASSRRPPMISRSLPESGMIPRYHSSEI